MQAIASPQATLTEHLYALVVYLNKNCNSDLLEALGSLELTLTQIKLLHHLQRAQRDVTLKKAAELVHVSLPAASRLVEDLVRRGLVAREEDSADRRVKRVALTDAGRAISSRLNEARMSRLEEFTQTLSADQRQALGGALSLLLEREEIAACAIEGAPS